MRIYHILPRTVWEQAQAQGEYRAASLATEGFIHASTGEQVLDTAARYYHGQQGLVLLAIDTEKLSSELRWEPVTRDGQEVRFPHIYGALNPDAVVRVMDFSPDRDGNFHFREE